MKKLFTQLFGAEFMELKRAHKIIVIYFAISFCLLGSLLPDNLNGYLVVANFAISAFLLRKVPFKDDLNDC